MLLWLRIENIAIIDSVAMDFEPGLNLLTGETGAGKSILIDALGLLLGNRASAELLRTGAPSGFVEAGFDVQHAPPGLGSRLADAGIEVDLHEPQLVIRREIAATGRSKVTVNGRSAVASLLRDVAAFLADVHGQGDSVSLLRQEAGLDLVDRFAEHDNERLAVERAYAKFRTSDSAYKALTERLARRSEQEQQLGFELDELSALDPVLGEDERLNRERDLLSHTERRRELASNAFTRLYDAEESVLSHLAGAIKEIDELGALDESVDRELSYRQDVLSQIEELSLFLRDYESSIDGSPERLEQIEQRLTLVERAKKRYGSLEQAVARLESLRAQLVELQTGDERREALEAERQSAMDDYWTLATGLTKKRSKAAKRLAKSVIGEFASLAMEKGRFEVSCDPIADRNTPDRWQSTGVDCIEFRFSANPGQALRPLAQVASGGELSRFMLALKVVSAKGDPSKTLIFDEIDSGIGGRVSHAVGQKLKELSATHQVICVTHQPQIASFAEAHFHVDKEQTADETVSQIRRLAEAERVDEIARMLAGAEVTPTARKHAARLVAQDTKVAAPRP